MGKRGLSFPHSLGVLLVHYLFRMLERIESGLSRI